MPLRRQRCAARGNWGNWALERRGWQEAADAYGYGRQAMDRLFQGQIDRVAKESWLKEAQGLPANAAYALARLGRLEEAVEVLEGGRARLLAEALEGNRRDLERLETLGHGDLLARYRAAADRIAGLQAQAGPPAGGQTYEPAALRDFAAFSQVMAAARELDAAIAAIRQVPGYEDFFLPPTFEKIRQAAPGRAALVYLVTTAVGSVALAVQGQTGGLVSALWLDDLTEAELSEVLAGPSPEPELGGYLGAYDGWRRNPGNGAARDAWHAALDDTTRWLWDNLMGAVVEDLRARGCRRPCSSRPARWGCCRCTRRGPRTRPRPPAGATRWMRWPFAMRPPRAHWRRPRRPRPASEPATLLAVDNPDGSLVFSAHEVDAVLSYFAAGQAAALRGPAATRRAVLDALAQRCRLSPVHPWLGGVGRAAGGRAADGGRRAADGARPPRPAPGRGAAGGALGLRDRHPRHGAAR